MYILEFYIYYCFFDLSSKNRTVTNSNVKTINSIALVSGASTNLQTYISNILSSSISTSSNQYSWNVPSTIETGASCKFISLILYRVLILFFF